MRLLIVTAALALLLGCGKNEPTEVHHSIGSDSRVDQSSAVSGTLTPAPAASSPPVRQFSEAEEVRAVVQFMWPIARKMGSIDWRWATCSDTTVGFQESRDCLRGVSSDADEAARSMPKSMKISSSCAKEVEAAHRTYIDGNATFLRDEGAWMDKHQARLRQYMKTKPLSDAWEMLGDVTTTGRPIGIDDKYGGAGLPRITAVQCLRRYFGCDGDGCVQKKANAQTGITN